MAQILTVKRVFSEKVFLGLSHLHHVTMLLHGSATKKTGFKGWRSSWWLGSAQDSGSVGSLVQM